MTAYGVSEWADFANTVVGGAAALAGLSFVGLSLRSCRDTEVSGVLAVEIAAIGIA